MREPRRSWRAPWAAAPDRADQSPRIRAGSWTDGVRLPGCVAIMTRPGVVLVIALLERAPAYALGRRASFGLLVEEQHLADNRLHRILAERLGDKEGRLGPLAGHQPVRVGGDEDHRHGESGEDVVHRVEA